ncbi:TPA: 4-hydroxy-tetrahydrodipicolinate synthase [Neisseria subflava]|jgi:dihydrodipicolinate synthase|uniref:4-hydroxy-tetrahydrodipicolinate synthase n=3 Tax=Neisseria TaxID=482 RepID=A0ABD7EWH9_NEIPE|nr:MULTISPECIES: 4-hydroxy-tetrahydrodipicolinate synthase [Neisseria]OFK83076.1 4-hydroxy-tetrahydrodipicolinate synthase [Neisseria sp. HMSC061E12]OFO39050.1 4-hydroxy-tetrahydrodipicolinate synthase [Neisseria sp. HMSC075C10]OFP78581.1 4-hydroxy-tetrahydrodipicolinate synthase [Neisseria sp. HMSC066B07]OFV33758.1 4-hydroxy-tetrahydrodipicolinate synthase [Neisseria sp. HMSC15G01]OHO85997.1 4-hydroxy-tetrahydrodipicolinate synthase [Neisseria sp. HMSC056A04]
MLKGSLVALITPMNQDGSINYEQLHDLIDWHIENGTDGIVAVGTTGESATLPVEEHLAVIEATVKHVNKRVPVIAGTGANNTVEAIALSKAAEQAGADYTLSVVPYYNKPSQEGIYQHFKAIAEATSIPMIIYNVPGRTVVSMSNDTILRLAEIPNIVGVKEASGNIGNNIELINSVPEGFAVFSGDDPTGLPFMLCGGHGVVTVAANVAPKLFADMCRAALEGDIATARRLNEQLIPIYNTMFCEPSPAAPKWGLSLLGKCEPHVRLPLVALTEAGQAKVRAALEKSGQI